MRITDLPSPGTYTNGQKLRIEAVKAISHVEIVAPRPEGVITKTDSAKQLQDFFTACAAALADYATE